MKLHTLYDVKRQIPVMNLLTDHSVSDCTMMEHIPYVPNSFYVFDKAYVSTPQLYNQYIRSILCCSKKEKYGIQSC